MSNLDNIFELLDELGEQLDIQKRENEKLALTNAPYFNPFEFFRTDEMGLSKLIAFLLDPKQSHGQGRMFLDRFLINLNLHTYLGYETVNVAVEQPLKDSSRRHDIFIQGLVNNKIEWVISIENKLRSAVDQELQLKDYIKDLSKYKKEKYILIYLPVWEQNPSDNSISEDELNKQIEKEHLKIIGAETICQWLDDINPYAKNVKSFVQQLKQYLRENIMQLGDEETAVLIEKICDNEIYLMSALQLINSQDAIYSNLLDVLDNQLKDKLRTTKILKGWHYSTYSKSGWNGTDKGFYIYNDKFKIYYGTMRAKFYDWCLSINFLNTKKYNQVSKLPLRALKWRLYDKGVWRYVSENKYKDWSNETWLEVLDGQLAEYIVSEFKESIKFLQEHNLE